MLGMPDQSHAVKINGYSSMFVKVSGKLSSVRWFAINE
jgi:hypothetical protein